LPAFFVGVWTAGRRARYENILQKQITSFMVWLILFAMVGAHVATVIANWPCSSLMLFGGLSFYGGLAGACLGGFIYIRIRGLPLWKVADVFAPSIALGDVFCRVGCLLSGCCYGTACNLPWAIRFPATHYTGGIPVHPTQMYDAFLNFLIYVGLTWLSRRKRFDGQIFTTYLTSYASCRIFLEYLRGDHLADPDHFGLKLGQIISLVVLVVGIVLALILSRPKLSLNKEQVHLHS